MMVNGKIEGACEFCLTAPVLAQASADFQAQPSLTSSIVTPNVVSHVRREFTEEDRAKLIHDPQPLINESEQHLAEKPCLYTKTGQCELACFIVKRAVRKPVHYNRVEE